MKTIEVSGKTVDEATMNALLQLGASSDRVKIEVLDEGGKGFLGMFGRSAKVRATLMDDEDAFGQVKEEKEEKVSTASPAASEKAPASDAKKEKAQEPSTNKNPLIPEEPKKVAIEATTVTGEKVVIDDTIEQRARRANQKNGGREGRENREGREANRGRAEAGRSTRHAGKVRRDRDGAYRDRHEDRSSYNAKPTDSGLATVRGLEEGDEGLEAKPVFEPKVYEIPKDADAVMAQTKEFLEKTLKAMNMETTVECKFDESGILNVNILGDSEGVIIGKRGATLDSLQYLTTLVVNKGREDRVRIKLDTEGYRERREKTLQRLALNLAKKAKRTGHRVVLEPMNPYERRIIHSTLQADNGVETHSDGEEPYRKVIITPRRRK